VLEPPPKNPEPVRDANTATPATGLP
jgi:hypothetical protein